MMNKKTIIYQVLPRLFGNRNSTCKKNGTLAENGVGKMNDFDTIKVATAYRVNGELVDHFPYEVNDSIEPVYTEFKGWKCDICKVRKYEDFPVEFKEYVEFIERETGCPIKIISVGPDREETIVR